MKNKETLEEVAKRLFPINTGDESLDYQNKVRKPNWIDGAKWQQERMYSEKDMQEYAEFCIECDRANLKPIIAKDWFEQFKKQ